IIAQHEIVPRRYYKNLRIVGCSQSAPGTGLGQLLREIGSAIGKGLAVLRDVHASARCVAGRLASALTLDRRPADREHAADHLDPVSRQAGDALDVEGLSVAR